MQLLLKSKCFCINQQTLAIGFYFQRILNVSALYKFRFYYSNSDFTIQIY